MTNAPGANAYKRFALSLCFACVAYSGPALAMEIDTGSDIKVRWDNTVKYSTAYRVKGRSDALAGAAAFDYDDGDRNFDRGFVSNRLDLLSEFDVSYGRSFGARVSAAAWYDTFYNTSNDNDSPATVNSTSIAYNKFTKDTRRLHGRNIELLDAFVWGRMPVGDMTLSVRAGRHTILYGESLFFGANGIAAGQAPIDAIKATSVPSTQFKELLMPVEQVSAQLQINSNLSVGGYYQFEWHKTRIPAAGSFLSTVDFLDAGGERILGAGFLRGPDIKARNSGQWGFQIRYRPPGGETDYGLYAINYHDKTPQVYLLPLANEYRLVYPEDIEAYGASFNTVLFDANVAGEVSVRRNTPLVSNTSMIDLTGTADGDDNPLYAVGNSLHAQASVVHFLEATSLWESASVIGEVAWNRRLKITKNASQLDPRTSRSAWGFRVLFEPQYFQPLPGVDLTVPISFGYTPDGKSSVLSTMLVDDGGDVSVGLNATYLNTWRAKIGYTHFLGNGGLTTDSTGNHTFNQPLKDRNFISFSIERTF